MRESRNSIPARLKAADKPALVRYLHCISHARKVATILAAVGCFMLAGFAEPGLAKPGLIATEKSDDSGLKASLDLSKPDFTPKSTRAGEFVELSWPGAGKYGRIGEPALPVVRKLFVVPPGAKVNLKVSKGKPVIIHLDQKIMPVQPPVEKRPGARKRALFRMDAREYARRSYAPIDLVAVEEVGVVRGHRLFLLELRPVSYNPAAGNIRFWRDLSAEISFTGRKKGRNLSAMQGLGEVVINPEIMPDDTKVSANYLIVVADEFEAAIQPFATAKQAQGFAVTTYAVTPGAANTQIKDYILGLWATADAPDYILLVGDTDTVPNFIGGGKELPNTDLPYACMDPGDDWYPDIAIGRFPVRSMSQLADVIDKTLAFEDGLYADYEYPGKAVFMASRDSYAITESTHNWVIDNYMTPHDIISDKLYSHTYNATTQQTRSAFNDGRLYGIYSGHGNEYSWADGPVFYQSDIRNLANGDLYPFVFSFACETGSYMLEECFTETWLLTAGKGAVAVYGASVDSFWTEDDRLEKCLFQTLFDDEIREIAPCWNAAMMRYLSVMGAGQTTRRYFEMYNLMGDPSAYVPLPPPGTGLKVSPRSDLESAGPPGGPFTPNSIVYTLENQNETPIRFEVTTEKSWISIDTPIGYLQGYATVDVRISIGLNAAMLPNAVHLAEISFVNTTDHDGDAARNVILDVGTPAVQYSWNMDEDPGWLTEGLWAWGPSTGGGGEYGGPDPAGRLLNVYGYNLDGDYENYLSPKHLVTTPIDCSDLSEVSLRFKRWLGVEKNAYDHAQIQVSNDMTNWTTIWENQTENIADTTWVLQEFDISEIADSQSQVFIKWTMGSTDDSHRFCGWNIDDVEIVALSIPAPGPITQTIIDVQNTAVIAPGQPVGPVTVELTNNTASPFNFVERPYIIGTRGHTVWLRQIPRRIKAGSTERRSIRVRTAPRFAEGQYTYGIMLTDTAGNEIDNDSFNFNVVGVRPGRRRSNDRSRLWNRRYPVNIK